MSARVTTRQVRRTIVGTAQGITNALETADRQGRLVSVNPPRPHSPGQYAVSAVFIEAVPVKPAERPVERHKVPTRTWVTIGAITAALGALVAIGALTLVLLRWCADNWQMLLGVGATLTVLALVLAARASRSGAHCPGAWHR